MRFAELDAVTVDGYGTLLQLVDPVPALRAALADRGVERTRDEVAGAFLAEVAYYKPHAHEGRDSASLVQLRRTCVGVFLRDLDAPLEPETFLEPFLSALVFEAVPGAIQALDLLRERGLRLGVVANWDCALPSHLERLGLGGWFDAVITSARAGVAKPDPAIFELAVRELDASPARVLHVGDEPVDEQGALAAGLRFAPAPLSEAFAGWT
jgi:putative hydrolase of the HAD superfamily